MSKNLIFAALAYLENHESSPSMTEMVNKAKGYEIYLKNTVVCLVGAKQHNPNDDVALVTNIRLDDCWKGIFEASGIDVYFCEYDKYRMPPATNYSLSYYKLCATDYIVRGTDYERYCFMDCDEYVVGGFDGIWKEADDAFLIKPNDSARTARVRSEINRINAELYPKSPYTSIVHFSSENYCATRELLSDVMGLCAGVYTDLRARPDIDPVGGDEVIFSIALSKYEGKIYSIKPYVLLANIGSRSYWVDTPDFRGGAIAIWHLPAEKRYALRWAYEYYVKKGRIPEPKLMARAARIRTIHSHFTLTSMLAILGDNTAVKRNLRKVLRRKRSDNG